MGKSTIDLNCLREIQVVLLSFWNLDILITLRTAVFSNGNLDFRRWPGMTGMDDFLLTFVVVIMECPELRFRFISLDQIN